MRTFISISDSGRSSINSIVSDRTLIFFSSHRSMDTDKCSPLLLVQGTTVPRVSLTLAANVNLTFSSQAHHLNLEQQGRSSTTEAYIYRHRLITRSTSTPLPIIHNYDFYSTSTSTSFLHYHQPTPTFVNSYAPANQTEDICPRQKNVHRNCQRSCHGINQNTNCRQQRICVCDHNCGFSCLARSNSL